MRRLLLRNNAVQSRALQTDIQARAKAPGRYELDMFQKQKEGWRAVKVSNNAIGEGVTTQHLTGKESGCHSEDKEKPWEGFMQGEKTETGLLFKKPTLDC